jgi:hypothetical protein
VGASCIINSPVYAFVGIIGLGVIMVRWWSKFQHVLGFILGVGVGLLFP